MNLRRPEKRAPELRTVWRASSLSNCRYGYIDAKSRIVGLYRVSLSLPLLRNKLATSPLSCADFRDESVVIVALLGDAEPEKLLVAELLPFRIDPRPMLALRF